MQVFGVGVRVLLDFAPIWLDWDDEFQISQLSFRVACARYFIIRSVIFIWHNCNWCYSSCNICWTNWRWHFRCMSSIEDVIWAGCEIILDTICSLLLRIDSAPSSSNTQITLVLSASSSLSAEDGLQVAARALFPSQIDIVLNCDWDCIAMAHLKLLKSFATRTNLECWSRGLWISRLV